MTETKKATKKAAPKPKKTAPETKKAAPVSIPPNPTRAYGTRVYTIRTKSKAEAARLVGECEFRLASAGEAGFELYADAAAYERMQGSK